MCIRMCIRHKCICALSMCACGTCSQLWLCDSNFQPTYHMHLTIVQLARNLNILPYPFFLRKWSQIFTFGCKNITSFQKSSQSRVEYPKMGSCFDRHWMNSSVAIEGIHMPTKHVELSKHCPHTQIQTQPWTVKCLSPTEKGLFLFVCSSGIKKVCNRIAYTYDNSIEKICGHRMRT